MTGHQTSSEGILTAVSSEVSRSTLALASLVKLGVVLTPLGTEQTGQSHREARTAVRADLLDKGRRDCAGTTAGRSVQQVLLVGTFLQADHPWPQQEGKHHVAGAGAALVQEAVLPLLNQDATRVHDALAVGAEPVDDDWQIGPDGADGAAVLLRRHGAGTQHGHGAVAAAVADVFVEAHLERGAVAVAPRFVKAFVLRLFAEEGFGAYATAVSEELSLMKRVQRLPAVVKEFFMRDILTDVVRLRVVTWKVRVCYRYLALSVFIEGEMFSVRIKGGILMGMRSIY